MTMENPQKHGTGLSRGNIGLIVGVAAVVLLIFGPVKPFGLIIRLAYLILIPALLFLGLCALGSYLRMDTSSNDRLRRAIFGAIAGALFVGAYLSATASYHTECDPGSPGNTTSECGGDYITVKGPDRGA